MESPCSLFVVVSTNSFNKFVKGTKITAARSSFDALKYEPMPSSPTRKIRSFATPSKPRLQPKPPLKLCFPVRTEKSTPAMPFALSKPVEKRIVRKLAPPTPSTVEPKSSARTTLKQPVHQTTTPPPSDKKLLRRTPSTPTNVSPSVPSKKPVSAASASARTPKPDRPAQRAPASCSRFRRCSL